MDQILNKYPKWLIVIVGLSLGLILIFLFNPPYSKCDAQYEIFQKSQTPFLFKDKAKKFNEKTGYEVFSEVCKVEGLPGSCLKFFEGLRLLISDLESVPQECSSDIAGRSEVKKVILDALKTIYKLAWGDKAPETYMDKAGWLDTVHLNVYCDLNSVLKENYNEDEANSLREEVIQSLMQKSSLDRNQVWNKSLFTIKCP